MSPVARALFAFSSLVATLAISLPARADAMPPPQDCEGQSVGDPCMNAGADADESGLCLEEMCSAPCDGGTCEGSCMLCEVIGSGSGASRGSSGSTSASTKSAGSASSKLGSGTGAAAGDGGTRAPSASGGSGCTAAPREAGTWGGGFALALGGLALGFARRRRAR
jgi:hypothetical protein